MSVQRGLRLCTLCVIMMISCVGCGERMAPGAAGARMKVVVAPPEGISLIGAHVSASQSSTLLKEWPQTLAASTKELHVQVYLSELPEDAELLLYLVSPSGPLLIDVDVPNGWSGDIPAGHYSDGTGTMITCAEYFTDAGVTTVSFNFKPKNGVFPVGPYKGSILIESLRYKTGIVELNWSVSEN